MDSNINNTNTTSNIIYRCKGCGANTIFDPVSQKLKCEFCGSLFDISEFEIDNAIDESDSETSKLIKQTHSTSNDRIISKDFSYDSNAFKLNGHSWSHEETGNMAIYNCSSCGSEIVASNISGTITCPYCDSHLVLTGQFSGDLKPDFIIPFTKTKEDAIKAYYNHLEKKKTYLPGIFKSANHIDEIHAIYVPYWFFDAKIKVDYESECITIKEWDSGLLHYTRHTYFDVARSGIASFENVPADSSIKMRDDLMNSIEPFNLSGAQPFNASYLSGYIAERYDVAPEQCIDRVVTRMKKSVEDFLFDTVNHYDYRNKEKTNYSLSEGHIKYGLMPVWYLNTTCYNKHYAFAMNGQTGKLVSDDLPKDGGKVFLYGSLMSLLFFVILLLLGLIVMGFLAIPFALICGPLFGFLCEIAIANNAMKSIKVPTHAKEYSKEKLVFSVRTDKKFKEKTYKRLRGDD